MENLPALIGALAAAAGVAAHGVLGHRWFTSQLAAVELPRSELFGSGETGRRVFATSWHLVTASFLVSAGALLLTAVGAVESRDLLRFIAVMYAAFLVVGALYMPPRPATLRKSPIAPLFVVVMVATAVLAWVASGSV